ncbi:hypothetical protein [Xenorhabdus bovienii]
MMMQIVGSFAEFERAMLHERINQAFPHPTQDFLSY